MKRRRSSRRKQVNFVPKIDVDSWRTRKIQEIPTPALVVDLDKLRRTKANREFLESMNQ